MASPTVSDHLLTTKGVGQTLQTNHILRAPSKVITVGILLCGLLAFSLRLHNTRTPTLSGAESEILGSAISSSSACTEALSILGNKAGFNVFQDIHDGDMKKIHLGENGLLIEPYKNDETWKVTTALPDDTCSVTVDFRVPGKPGPPPVSLRLQLALIKSSGTATEDVTNIMVVFYDPSGTIAEPTMPLNVWYGM
eukprot:CAMPEP_0185730610 /NCGR_PEP_ID=MMETSP1171-20130828/10475_1 /TAXON_ID=374046 /ORGANISM="Helicotheca tamensis, Strain CCMP826" /LENGTH=194 /DNA_ID=CAMNT_0028399697 /DNA_START=131 /DNA_END=715 /DNA_ORIENTATION=+